METKEIAKALKGKVLELRYITTQKRILVNQFKVKDVRQYTCLPDWVYVIDTKRKEHGIRKWACEEVVNKQSCEKILSDGGINIISLLEKESEDWRTRYELLQS